MPGYVDPKWYYELEESFRFHLQTKKNFISHNFLEILQRYENFLSWVLWACLATNTLNDSINLQKTSMFTCTSKNTLSFTSFLEYYILKNPAIWLANIILGHNSRTRYGIRGEISMTILVFILDYYHEKLMTNFFKKSKKPILGSFWNLFVQSWAKMNLPGKKGSISF